IQITGSRADLNDWIQKQGIDISSLGLGRPPILRGAPTLLLPGSRTYNLPLPSVPLVSGYGCAVRRRLESFAQLSSVEKSKVKREQSADNAVPNLSTLNVPFGRGITVSRMAGRAVIRTVEGGPDPEGCLHVRVQQLAAAGPPSGDARPGRVLLRQGQHVESKTDEGAQVSDVRIHTAHAILDIRYGTVPHRERLRLLWHAKKHAVSQRWAQEREVLLTDQNGGALGWTDKDKEHILRTGLVPGYRGDYCHDVDSFPELADDPSNIVFRKVTRKR
ncbi:unnamed protein product, partial [Ixodes pacificus]